MQISSGNENQTLNHCSNAFNYGPCSRHWQVDVLCISIVLTWVSDLFLIGPVPQQTCCMKKFSYFILTGAELLWKESGFVKRSGSVWITAAGWTSRQDLSPLRHLACLWLIFLLSYKHFIQTEVLCTEHKISIIEPVQVYLKQPVTACMSKGMGSRKCSRLDFFFPLMEH